MKRTSLFLLSILFAATVIASNAPAPGDFSGCPAQGDGGDTTLNTLKNRSDAATSPESKTITDILAMNSPTQLGEQNPRNKWTQANLDLVAPFEKTAVSVEGYFFNAEQEGKEHCNCERPDLHDVHMWILKTQGQPQNTSVVMELTPRWRAANPAWKLETLTQLKNQHALMRITGWMMFDQEHPEQLPNSEGKRGTLWEVHPVTKIEVFTSGQWRELE